jgi:hypothetical protein
MGSKWSAIRPAGSSILGTTPLAIFLGAGVNTAGRSSTLVMLLNRTDQFFEVRAQRFGITPESLADNFSLRVEDELSVGRAAKSYFDVIFHRVADPRNLRTKSLFGNRNVFEAFFEIEGRDVVVDLGVFYGFVNVKELNFVAVVAVHGFQTGNISKKRRSGQAPEIDDGVLSTQVGEIEFRSVFVKCDQIVNGVTHDGLAAGKSFIELVGKFLWFS